MTSKTTMLIFSMKLPNFVALGCFSLYSSAQASLQKLIVEKTREVYPSFFAKC